MVVSRLLLLSVLAATLCSAHLQQDKPYVDCSATGSYLVASNVAIQPSATQINDNVYLTFDVDNIAGATVGVTEIIWAVYLNSTGGIGTNSLLQTRLNIPVGRSETRTTSVVLNQVIDQGIYTFQLDLFNSTQLAACWSGTLEVQNGTSLLTVSKVTIHPSFPHINDQIYLTFEYENESDEVVNVYQIFWAVGSNISYRSNSSYYLPSPVNLSEGQSGDGITNKMTLEIQLNPGTYGFGFGFFSEAGVQVAFLEGDLEISGYFLGLAGLSFLLMS